MTTNRFLLLQALALAVCLSSAAAPWGEEGQQTELERYNWLLLEGITDSEVSNRTVHELIQRGLHHEDERIVRLTLGAMSLYSAGERDSFWNPGSSPPLERSLQDIPGLRASLLAQWHRGYRGASSVLGMDSPEAAAKEAEINAIPEADVNFESVLAEWVAAIPHWDSVPAIMATTFPRDPKVHEIIWQYSEVVGDESAITTRLLLLNAGEFITPEAEELRVQVLTDKTSEWFDVRMAAHGLAVYQSDAGLEALVERVDDAHPYAEVVAALCAYGPAALPYVEAIREAIERGNFRGEEQLMVEMAQRRMNFWTRLHEQEKEIIDAIR